MTTTVSEKPVTLDMTIGDVVDKYPAAAEVMLGYGLHCVGCAVNPYETIEQGALGHGMSEDMIKGMLDEINLVITKKPEFELNEEGVTISPSALETLKLINDEEHGGKAGLKVKATKEEGGLDYYLDLVKAPEEGDKVMEWKGLQIFIDDASLKMMKPSVVDYLKTTEGEGFKVISLKDESAEKISCCESGECSC